MFQIKWAWKNLMGYHKLYIFALVTSVILPITNLINPKLTQMIVDNCVVGVADASGNVVKHLETLVPIVIAMCIVQLIRSALGYAMVISFDEVSQGAMVNIRRVLYSNLQENDMEFYDEYRTGDLMTRLTGDLEMVRHALAWVFRQLISSSVLFLATLIYFFTIDWLFTLTLLAITPFIFIVVRVYSKKIRPMYVELRERLSNLNTAAQENIEGNRVVKAFAREDYEIAKFDEKNAGYMKANLKVSFYWLKFYPAIEMLASSLTIITVLVGGLFIIWGRLTAGELMAFSSLTWALCDPLRTLGMHLNDLQRFFASANKIIEVYYQKPLIQSKDNAKTQDESLNGELEFKNVTFRFKDEVIFDDISFAVKPGQTVAIMGATGSGKTTIANLILRFYDVQKGEVLVDGVNVKDWNLQTLRSNVGMATQDVFLFSDTIEGNIAYGDPEMPEEDVHEYAYKAAADDFIKATSEGYDTIIGERGVGLSGGQKQRIALARAMAIKPPILILDDTTSAVDMETEKFIQHQLQNLDFPCTKMIIAQRISSVKKADQILILQDKKIVERGTHEELLRQKGYYYEVYKIQNNGGAEEMVGVADGAQ